MCRIQRFVEVVYVSGQDVALSDETLAWLWPKMMMRPRSQSSVVACREKTFERN